MRRKGFTTIEMIIVVILIGVIAAIGFPRLRDGLEKQNVRSAKALIATMVATARGAAIQRGCAATRIRSIRRAANADAAADRCPRAIIRVTSAAVVTMPSTPTVSTMIAMMISIIVKPRRFELVFIAWSPSPPD